MNLVEPYYYWRDAPRADFGVIGDPISQSWSPRIQQAALDLYKICKRYVGIQVPKQEFDDALDHLKNLGYYGLNVTAPLKPLAYQWAKRIEDDSDLYRSVNTLNLPNQSAINTDVPGFFDTLRSHGKQNPESVLILGAGATACTLAKALAQVQYTVSIYHRDYEKACTIIEQQNIQAQVMENLEIENASIVLNATSASLNFEDLSLDWSIAKPNTLAYELSYSYQLSPFLKSARNAGLNTLDGREMLVAQAVRSLSWWLGQAVSSEIMLAAI